MTPENTIKALSEHNEMLEELCRDLADLLEESVVSYDFHAYFCLRAAEALKDAVTLACWKTTHKS